MGFGGPHGCPRAAGRRQGAFAPSPFATFARVRGAVSPLPSVRDIFPIFPFDIGANTTKQSPGMIAGGNVQQWAFFGVMAWWLDGGDNGELGVMAGAFSSRWPPRGWRAGPCSIPCGWAAAGRRGTPTGCIAGATRGTVSLVGAATIAVVFSLLHA